MKEWREKSKLTEKSKSCAPGSNVSSLVSSRPVESVPIGSMNKTITNTSPLVKVSSASLTVRSHHHDSSKIDVRTQTDTEAKIVSFSRSCLTVHFLPDIKDSLDNTSFASLICLVYFCSCDAVCRPIVHPQILRARCHHLPSLKTCSMLIASWARR